MKPWHIEFDGRSTVSHPSLEEALRLAHTAERRSPTEADARTSTFPVTPAAREALRLGAAEPRVKRHRIARDRDGQIVRRREA